MWKQRFPCLRNLLRHYHKAKKTIIATAVLHNLSIHWNDQVPDDEVSDVENGIDNLHIQDQLGNQYYIEEDQAELKSSENMARFFGDTLCNSVPERRRREGIVWCTEANILCTRTV